MSKSPVETSVWTGVVVGHLTGNGCTGNFLTKITPLILMWNEEENIGRVLDKLKWAERVVIVDSYSTDGSIAVAQGYDNVSIYSNKFTDHATQWNFGLCETGIESPWVFAMDADYLLTDELVGELATLEPKPETCGFYARFRYAIHGKVLRHALYPPVAALFRRSSARYRQQGHTQRLFVDGEVETLKGFVIHDDRKPLLRWLSSQDKYSALECAHLLGARWSDLRWQDRIRLWIFIAPWLVPLYFLFLRGGLFDGYHGWLYALQRGIAEAVLSIKLVEHRIIRKKPEISKDRG